jgi:uncharacterized tellurite resistance protein B-like protein
VVARSEPNPEPAVQELSAAPYIVAAVRLGTGNVDLHQVSRGRFASWIAEIVKIEAPVHKDEVARRIADAAGVKRIGNRIEAAFEAGVQETVRARSIERRGDFLWLVGMPRPPVRDRSALSPAARKLALVAPEEIAEAICSVVKAAYGIDVGDIPQAVCRLLGFGRTSEEMAAFVNNLTTTLAKTGRLEIQDGHVTPGKPRSAEDRPFLRIVT